MGNQDWSNLGEQIKNTVQDAIDSQNFRQLNESIKNTVNNAMDNVNQSLNQANQRLNGRDWGEGYRERSRDRLRNRSHIKPQNPWDTKSGSNYKNSMKKVKNEIISSGGLKGAGYSLSIVGYIFAGCFGLAVFILMILGLVGPGFLMGFQIALGILIPFFIASGIMGLKGSNLLGRLKRFRLYNRQLAGRSFCSVKELADASGKSQSFVQKDLRKMIQKNMFLQGHLDSKGTCLMITDEVYNQYLAAQHSMEIRQQEKALLSEAELRSRAEAKAALEYKKKQGNSNNQMPEEVRKVIEDGRNYIEKIKNCNDVIRGEEVSEKITRMEIITSKIFERVEQHPEHIPDLRKFMEYYLPTTVKLLNAYEELEVQPVQGENILSSKGEIEDTLDTINYAFEKLLDGFFQDTSWDISSDISVLQAMFAQEGLTGQDFKMDQSDFTEKDFKMDQSDFTK